MTNIPERLASRCPRSRSTLRWYNPSSPFQRDSRFRLTLTVLTDGARWALFMPALVAGGVFDPHRLVGHLPLTWWPHKKK